MAMVVYNPVVGASRASRWREHAERAAEVASWLNGHRENLMNTGSELLKWWSGPYRERGGTIGKKGPKANNLRIGRKRASQDGMTRRSYSQPVAVGTTLTNPTYWHQASLPQDNGLGEGIRVVGRQYFGAGQTGAADDKFFAGAYDQTLQPDLIGGRLALLARTYSKFAFRHVRIFYVPTCATSQSGSFVMSYYDDPAAGAVSSITFTTAMQTDPCVISPMREPAVLEMNYTGNECWYCESDVGSNTAIRETCQGDFYAIANLTTASVVVGYFLIEYVCDLYQPVSDLGFTVTRMTKAEKTEVDAVLAQMRGKDGHDDVVSIATTSTMHSALGRAPVLSSVRR